MKINLAKIATDNKKISTFTKFFHAAVGIPCRGLLPVFAKGARRTGYNATNIGGLTTAFAQGFTLAEILITLGIIGIVAAMVIPSLIASANIRTVEAKLKQDYSILSQMFKSSESVTSVPLSFANNDMNKMKEWYNNSIAPYIKPAETCFNTAGCWHTMGATKTLSGVVAYCNRNNIGVGDDIIVMRLPNGTSISLDIYGASSVKEYFGVNSDEEYAVVVFVDANGNKPPNVVGKDIYAFVYTSRGLVPAGQDMSPDEVDTNCSINATGSNAGYWCASKLKRNNWKIDPNVWAK